MHALTELERAKWRFWNGYKKKGLIGLVDLHFISPAYATAPQLCMLSAAPVLDPTDMTPFAVTYWMRIVISWRR
jgi:hypothetical protein